jgi:hypothetical protein
VIIGQGFAMDLKRDNSRDRSMGWRRIREWLKPQVSADGLMSRPSPKPMPEKHNPPSDFDASAAFKLIDNRRRRLAHIGHELEAASACSFSNWD